MGVKAKFTKEERKKFNRDYKELVKLAPKMFDRRFVIGAEADDALKELEKEENTKKAEEIRLKKSPLELAIK